MRAKDDILGSASADRRIINWVEYLGFDLAKTDCKVIGILNGDVQAQVESNTIRGKLNLVARG